MRSEMKHLIGKSCLLEVDYHNKILHFHVSKVISVTSTHISFIDKFNKEYSFRLNDVVEVDKVNE
jgi:hypothetical protein